MSQHKLMIQTNGRGTVEIDHKINTLITAKEFKLCHIFVAHTSASLIITGNEDSNLLLDVENYFQNNVKDGDNYLHNNEGNFDMSGHIRSILTDTEKTIPVVDGKLALGRFQGLFLYEHRAGKNARQLIITLI